MAAQPLGILALIEGTYQGLNAALFNLDITFWNATGVKQSEVEKKYKDMLETPSYCSFQFIRNITSFVDVRARSFYAASRSPRMAITAYISFILVVNIGKGWDGLLHCNFTMRVSGLWCDVHIRVYSILYTARANLIGFYSQPLYTS